MAGVGLQDGVTADTGLGRCADCRALGDRRMMFAVTPPPGRPEGGGLAYLLCTTCWDTLVASAVLGRIR